MSTLPIWAGASGPWRAIGVTDPGDAVEREADALADAVLSGTTVEAAGPPGGAGDRNVRRSCACEDEGRRCSSCVRRQPAGAARAAVPARGEGLPGAGQALSPADQAFFGRGFGLDLSEVRVHTGTPADMLARHFGADAFAVGDDLVFASGRFQPGHGEGRRLLAHELAHVAQERREGQGGPPPPAVRRWAQAGNCWDPVLTPNAIGQVAHGEIQTAMISTFSPAMYTEISIPGGGGTVLDPLEPSGRADLFVTEPLGVVPAVAGQGGRPAPHAFAPPQQPPLAALIGEIKPATWLLEGKHPMAVAQLASYLSAHDGHHRRTAGFVHAPTQKLVVPAPPMLTRPGSRSRRGSRRRCSTSSPPLTGSTTTSAGR